MLREVMFQIETEPLRLDEGSDCSTSSDYLPKAVREEEETPSTSVQRRRSKSKGYKRKSKKAVRVAFLAKEEGREARRSAFFDDELEALEIGSSQVPVLSNTSFRTDFGINLSWICLRGGAADSESLEEEEEGAEDE